MSILFVLLAPLEIEARGEKAQLAYQSALKEKSTDGIEVDPSKFQLNVGEVRNWKPIDERKQGLLGCSRDVAQLMVEKMLDISVNRDWVQEEERGEEILENDDNKNRKQVGTDGAKEEVSLVNEVCLCWL